MRKRMIGLVKRLKQHKQTLNVTQLDRPHRRAAAPDKRQFFLIHVDPQRVERQRHLAEARRL